MCCQRATKELLLVYGDSKIMLGWIIEIQILAKILSVRPRIAIAIPKSSSREKPNNTLCNSAATHPHRYNYRCLLSSSQIWG